MARPENPRVLAARTLATCARHSKSLAHLLSRLDRVPEKGLIQSLCYGTARHFYPLERRLNAMLEHPLGSRALPLQMLMMMGLHELNEGRRAPHTVTNLFVDAARILGDERASKLCNAILRRHLREQSAHAPAEAAEFYPTWMVEHIERDWPEQCGDILAAGNEHPPLHLRVNTAKISREELLGRFEKAGVAARPLEGIDCAIQVETPQSPQNLPGFAEGLISVQDISAQFAVPMLRTPEGARVLDACSAPGGKLCHWLESCPGISASAVEINRTRAPQIQANLKRLGLRAKLILADAAKPKTWPEEWLGRGRKSKRFDRILLDAPCSGSGVMRRQADIRMTLSPRQLEENARTQLRLLRALWPLLAPGGLMLYSVCSIFRQEGDSVVARFLEQSPLADRARIAPVPGTVRTDCGLQLLPGGGLGGDGFYYALLRKSTPGAA
ncbi:MAG: 16S rRNA (cytosine(967)-C(5))-methyltransferase RsmB [Gammaproteobacteria bacterium AqS3]|nr:16S rRNA (cytosine(967)-C(5))-methyltransferase RsmB [Gammaproteobacteria bacterium AqS3]